MTEILKVTQEGNFEIWTLNRPQALNAFNKDLLLAISAQVERVDKDLSVRCVVIKGAGDRAFSAGADLKERKAMPPHQVPAFVSLIGGTFQQIAECSAPFIAAIDGYAFGGGLEIALACDIRAVGPRAKMGLTETRLAIVPGAGGTQRLPRLVGAGRAKELILSGRRIDADEALDIGLAELDGRDSSALHVALECAGSIAACGPLAVRAAKQAIDGALGQPLPAGLAHERSCYDRTLDSSDRQEALVAFAEKRTPVFTGS
ncbi:MAG: enoyl-CoA hydratase [Rickettsiales bacterium]|nr:enoyl-CoA hydratase [Rickettsiales bacterium]|tara:strand:- start:6210 stop:6989 length:780 start_codon:yes stop_codon:yes gene_type:complete